MEARRIHTQKKLASQNRLAWVKGAANQQWDEPAFHCYLLRMGVLKAVGCFGRIIKWRNETKNHIIT